MSFQAHTWILRGHHENHTVSPNQTSRPVNIRHRHRRILTTSRSSLNTPAQATRLRSRPRNHHHHQVESNQAESDTSNTVLTTTRELCTENNMLAFQHQVCQHPRPRHLFITLRSSSLITPAQAPHLLEPAGESGITIESSWDDATSGRKTWI